MTDRQRTTPTLPLMARVLLRLRTPRRLHEWMAGDLEETYHDKAARQGVRAARMETGSVEGSGLHIELLR